jgi:hypothetical protein
MPAYVDSAAAAVATSSTGPPALTTPDRTTSPGTRSTGSDSPVSADSSSTAEDNRRPSTGMTSPVPTSSRSPGTTTSTDTSATPPSMRCFAVRGARSTKRLNSRRARAAARASSSCPLMSITVIIAPAKGSLTQSAPANASNAITSTLSCRRRTAATIQTTERTKPSIVPSVHKTRAGSSAPKSNAMPPAANQSTEEKSRSSSFMSSKRRMSSSSNARLT